MIALGTLACSPSGPRPRSCRAPHIENRESQRKSKQQSGRESRRDHRQGPPEPETAPTSIKPKPRKQQTHHAPTRVGARREYLLADSKPETVPPDETEHGCMKPSRPLLRVIEIVGTSSPHVEQKTINAPCRDKKTARNSRPPPTANETPHVTEVDRTANQNNQQACKHRRQTNGDAIALGERNESTPSSEQPRRTSARRKQ